MSKYRKNLTETIKDEKDSVNQMKVAMKNPIAKINDEVCKVDSVNGKSNDDCKILQKITLKTPKGTRDYNPQQVALRQNVLEKIIAIFKKHGAESIDTPVFELSVFYDHEEDANKIYDLKDQGGEILSLRYDLTVPLARYLAMNNLSSIKRYHIAKVYRRDNPAKTKGRYREFYQCDFDIAGNFDAMIPDAESVKILAEILESLNIGEFTIKINHRLFLAGMFEACGIPASKFRSICTAIDKLDKTAWLAVREEMINERGLDAVSADKIGTYVQLNGGPELIEKLLNDPNLSQIPAAVTGLEEIKLLFHYCYIMGLKDKIRFDLSLARGLSYYTAIIFESTLKVEPIISTKVGDAQGPIGSLAGGGRYDNLVSLFTSKNKQIPCVGVSIGIERIFAIIEAQNAANKHKCTKEIDVYVVSAHKGLHEKRMEFLNLLWNNHIKAEHSYKANPKLLVQLQYCEDNCIPLAIVFGLSELERGIIKLRDVTTRNEEEIEIDSMVKEIKRRIIKNNNFF